MQDLSGLAADSIWATSQHAGTTSDRSAAFAPSTPSSPGADPATQPFVKPVDHAETTETHADSKLVLKFGQWNELP